MDTLCPREDRRVLLIVGGGYAGAALTIRLLERFKEPLTIVLTEPRALLGAGEAYSTNERAHLMNGPAGNFSLHPGDLSHLTRWVERNGRSAGLQIPPGGAEDVFIPRQLFGRYVDEELQRAIATAAPDIRVSHWRSEVIGLTRQRSGGWQADFADGRQLCADATVLATGVFPLAQDPALAPLADDWRLARPAQSERLDRISRLDDVLVVGASLSMVDAVASLEARGFSGKYHVISRRGHLIQPLRKAEETVPILLQEALPRTTSELLRLVIKARRALLAEGRDWQALPLSLRPFILPLWLSASTAERLRFARHLRALWDVTAHRAAPASYAAIDAARKAGRFNAAAARLVTVARDGDRLRVTFRPRGHRALSEVTVDAIIDARGHQEHDWGKIREPLAQNLLRTGIVRRHETGFGIDATPQGIVIAGDGSRYRDRYAIGHPLRGTAWESSSLTELRGQADALATLLAETLAATGVDEPEERLAIAPAQ